MKKVLEEDKERMIDFSEQTPEMKIKEPELPELYQEAYIKNDTGDSNEFCQNTSSHD